MKVAQENYVSALIELSQKLYNKGLLLLAIELHENNKIFIETQKFTDQSKIDFFLSLGELLVTSMVMENEKFTKVTEILDKCENIIKDSDTEDYARVGLLRGLSLYYASIRNEDSSENVLDEAVSFITKALPILDSVNSHKYLSQGWFYRGLINENRNKLTEAKNNYLKSYKIAKNNNLKLEMSFPSRHLGFIHMKNKNLEEGLAFLKESLKLREDVGYKIGIPFSMISLGDIYIQLNDYRKALKCYKFGYDLGQGINNSMSQMVGAVCVGRTYIRLEDFDKATPYLNTAIEFANKFDNKQILDLAKQTLKTQSINE